MTIGYRDLVIEQLSDDLAAVTEERNSYRLTAQMAIGELAIVTKERDNYRRRLFAVFDQQRSQPVDSVVDPFMLPDRADPADAGLHA